MKEGDEVLSLEQEQGGSTNAGAGEVGGSEAMINKRTDLDP